MTKVARPWGEYEVLYADENYWTKIIWIHPGHRLSLQVHELRDEYWIPLTEHICADIGGVAIDLQPWKRYYVAQGTNHRLSNEGYGTAVLVEIATGTPDEEDIIRLEDLYGRV